MTGDVVTLILDGLYLSICFSMGHSTDTEKNIGVLGTSYILGGLILQ